MVLGKFNTGGFGNFADRQSSDKAPSNATGLHSVEETAEEHHVGSRCNSMALISTPENDEEYRDSLFGMNKMNANPNGANNTSFMYKSQVKPDPVNSLVRVAEKETINLRTTFAEKKNPSPV